MEETDSQDIALETPPKDVFNAPSIHQDELLQGTSYTHHASTPDIIKNDLSRDCVLGVDEAGRGPVLGINPIYWKTANQADDAGPMVYGVFYLPVDQHKSLLAEKHHFDDSKVLTPKVRSNLMQALCASGTDLHKSCGWATRVMSARDISSAMLKPAGTYNLNAQAMDATIDLIKEVFAQGVNITQIYVDTIGKAELYQKKLERIFPTTMITVCPKADSLYPCVSAASVCAKVTRDAALDVCYQSTRLVDAQATAPTSIADAWGSGYPSDARAVTWLKQNMDPLFGWGNECRFSWSTAKSMLEIKGNSIKIDWPDVNDDEQARRMTDFYITKLAMKVEKDEFEDELATWYGKPVSESVFRE
ncbi:MAG: hypothetical protein LQ352_002406 [Teloschistes flavicans]|nr:MAG: hypothetical protein LQ352_002406 [Teloschistes flavicans]